MFRTLPPIKAIENKKLSLDGLIENLDNLRINTDNEDELGFYIYNETSYIVLYFYDKWDMDDLKSLNQEDLKNKLKEFLKQEIL